jgi:putative ABC transport system permease protein
MEIGPILSAMLRNKTGAILIALQIALTLAIVCNAMFIIRDRLDKIGRPVGFDVNNTFVVTMVAYAPDYNADNAIRMNLDLLRGLPGVVDASYINEIPVSGGGWSDGIRTKPDLSLKGVSIADFHVDDHGLNTLGLRLVEGRGYTPDEIVHIDGDHYTPPPVAILSRAAAEKLFPGQDALGKVIYNGVKPMTVVGVVDRMVAAWPHWEGFERAMLLPTVITGNDVRYMVRTMPGERDRLMKIAEQKLGDAHTGNFVRRVRSMEEYSRTTYESDHAMTVVLAVVTGMILTITALGIVGLASFSVSQRTKQIGTRRALGARRSDIVRYFMTENWLVTSIGVTLGAILAVALNFWLVTLYDIPSISWYYIPVGILCLWALGLLAVLGPALKAAAIPPAIATRSV